MKPGALRQGDIAAGDGRSARSTIGLQHIAVQHDLALSPRAVRSQIARNERPTSRWISWVRPALLAGGGFAPHAVMGGAGQHAIFRGDPAFAGTFQEGWGFFFQAGSAQNMGIAELHQAGAFGMKGKPGGQADGPQGIGTAGWSGAWGIIS